MKNNIIVIVIISILVGGGLGFYGGIKYQQSRRTNFNSQFGNRQVDGRLTGSNGTNINRNGTTNRGGFRPVNGEIISADNKSITVKLQDGSSKIILLTDKTEINKAEKVDSTELKTGVNVAVFGTENTDGSVSAQNIQVGTNFRMLNNPNN